jgi:hypothetical protein
MLLANTTPYTIRDQLSDYKGMCYFCAVFTVDASPASKLNHHPSSIVHHGSVVSITLRKITLLLLEEDGEKLPNDLKEE